MGWILYKRGILITKLTQGVRALKGMVTESEKSENKGLVRSIPADLYPYIAKFNNDPYMIITSANVVLGMPEILNIFPVVESKLLDILSYLEKQFGILDDLDIDVNSKTKEELQSITNHIYILIYNDESITVGDNNKFKDSTIATSINK